MFGAIRRCDRRSWRRTTVVRAAHRSGRHASDSHESGPLAARRRTASWSV